MGQGLGDHDGGARSALHCGRPDSRALRGQGGCPARREKYGYENTTDGYLDLSIEGFPFLTQAASGEFDHVTLIPGMFYVDTTTNAQGGLPHRPSPP